MKSNFLSEVIISAVALLLTVSSCGPRRENKAQMPYLTKDKIEYIGTRWGGYEVEWKQEKFILDRINHRFECYRYPYWNERKYEYEFRWYFVGSGSYRESPELNGKINIEFDSSDGYRSSGLWKDGVISWSRMELEGYPDGATLVCEPKE